MIPVVLAILLAALVVRGVDARGRPLGPRAASGAIPGA